MKAASLAEIKSTLRELPPKELLQHCMRLAKHKKENKELLTYLLFEAENENSYIQSIKEEVIPLFNEMNKSNVYFAKKSIRKILRIINKHIKHSGLETTELELRLFFCNEVKKLAIDMDKSVALKNLYQGQIKKIELALKKLHEDLRYDYQRSFEEL